MRIRRASGSREDELVRRATRLRQSVDPLLPRLAGEADRASYDKLRQALEAVREDRDDAARLGRVGRFADPLVRAYAGLLAFYLEPELPAFAVARYPAGEISFAPLNAAPKEAHIAVQNADDPHRLLLGYLERARHGEHFFATDDALYATGASPEPPEAFLTALRKHLPYRLEVVEGGRRWACTHRAREEPVPSLRVHWNGPEITFELCERCARDDRQLLSRLTEGVAVPKPDRVFETDASLNVLCPPSRACPHQRLGGLDRTQRREYVFGNRSDRAILREFRQSATDALRSTGQTVYVAAGHCYGAERGAFLDALQPTPPERRALEAALGEPSGLVEVDEAAASPVLERLWPQRAEPIAEAITGSPAEARRLMAEISSSGGRVADRLRRAAQQAADRQRLGQLPRYEGLSAEAARADGCARAFRVGGAAEAVRRALEGLPPAGRERGVAYGFLAALGGAEPHNWQFADTERNFGLALAPSARQMLEAPDAEYDGALAGLMAAAGVADWGHRAT